MGREYKHLISAIIHWLGLSLCRGREEKKSWESLITKIKKKEKKRRRTDVKPHKSFQGVIWPALKTLIADNGQPVGWYFINTNRFLRDISHIALPEPEEYIKY